MEPNPHFEAGALDPRLEDYLDHVCAPLVGQVPYARRRELRAEVAEHILSMVEARQELGEGYEEALQASLARFGEPSLLAREWLREGRTSPVADESMWQAAVLGIKCFVPLLPIVWLLMSVFSSRQPTAVELAILVVLLPAAGGLASGFRTRRWRLLAGCAGPAAFVFASALVGNLAGEMERNPFSISAVVALIYWIPIGCLASEIGGRLRARQELRRGSWRFQET